MSGFGRRATEFSWEHSGTIDAETKTNEINGPLWGYEKSLTLEESIRRRYVLIGSLARCPAVRRLDSTWSSYVRGLNSTVGFHVISYHMVLWNKMLFLMMLYHNMRHYICRGRLSNRKHDHFKNRAAHDETSEARLGRAARESDEPVYQRYMRLSFALGHRLIVMFATCITWTKFLIVFRRFTVLQSKTRSESCSAKGSWINR